MTGTVYGTVDERCAACVVKGGPEERCVGEAWDQAFGEKLGRPCPRVELDTGMLAEVDLLGWLVHDDKKALAEARFWTIVHAWNLSAEDADLLLERVSHVLSDPTVLSLLHPKPAERDEE